MIHDKSICDKCRYNDIKGYSLKLRHCNKCDNYGERRLPDDVRIIRRPSEVEIECPHCNEDIEVKYDNFVDFIGSDYPGDWGGQIIECPRCEKEIEIDDIEWD